MITNAIFVQRIKTMQYFVLKKNQIIEWRREKQKQNANLVVICFFSLKLKFVKTNFNFL